MGLEVFVVFVSVPCRFEWRFRRWHVWQSLSQGQSKVKIEDLATYRRQAYPKLVQRLLWPFRTLLVSPEIRPRVFSGLAYDQPPSRIIREMLCR